MLNAVLTDIKNNLERGSDSNIIKDYKGHEWNYPMCNLTSFAVEAYQTIKDFINKKLG